MEERFVYLHLKWKHVIVAYIIFTFSSISVAFYSATLPVQLSYLSNSNDARAATKGYQIFPNGTRYYDLINSKNISRRWMLGDWFDEVLLGKQVYVFGSTHKNYCWKKDRPGRNNFPSLYRASQLRAAVQVPLRAAVLITLSIRFCQSLLIGFAALRRRDSSTDHIWFSFYVVNEILQGVSLFGLTNYLFTPDQQYILFLAPCFALAHVSFALKMAFSIWHTGVHWMTTLRLFFAAVVLVGWTTVTENSAKFISDPVCDQYDEFWRAAPEYWDVLILFAASLLDAKECWSYEIVESANDCEMECIRDLNRAEELKTEFKPHSIFIVQ